MVSNDVPDARASAKALLLHPDDTVLVCTASLAPGDTLLIDGSLVRVTETVGVGHKLARRRLEVGDRVLKYGAPIGSITQGVEKGAHVHSHNMQSDYIPTHSRQDIRGNRP